MLCSNELKVEKTDVSGHVITEQRVGSAYTTLRTIGPDHVFELQTHVKRIYDAGKAKGVNFDLTIENVR